MKRTRYIFTISFSIFIAYCTMDAGYSYWTDQVTISGEATYNHTIEVILIEEIALGDEPTEQNDIDTEKENEADLSNPKDIEIESKQQDKILGQKKDKDIDRIETDKVSTEPEDNRANEQTDSNTGIDVILKDRKEEVQENNSDMIGEEGNDIDKMINNDNHTVKDETTEHVIEEDDTKEIDITEIEMTDKEALDKEALDKEVLDKEALDNNIESVEKEIEDDIKIY